VKGYAPCLSIPKFARALNPAEAALGLLLCAVLIALCVPSVSYAQDTGYISGTVIDKSGAAVAGADVLLANTAGSITRATTTNSDGAYTIAGLPGDIYNLTVSAKGFQKYNAQKITLNVGEKARVDVTLSVGAMSEEITVTGESVAQVETQSSDLTSTITGKQINNLELNGRNFTQLVTLAPGVVNQSGSDEGKVGVYGNVAYSMNGGRTEYNNWELDGGDNMDNGSNSTLNVYPNLEAIAEFKVLTSNYGAQYGRNGSGTVEVETKSGTTAFHGSAFEYLRNDMFNARPWESGNNPDHPNPPYKKHDFGYTIGGPVYIPHLYNKDKKKTFFFWSQEWRREKNPSSILQNVPSTAERTGNFSDLCPGLDCPHQANGSPFPGNIVPIESSGVANALLQLIPSPNTTQGGFPAVSQIISTPTTWREELVRVDHNLTDNYRLTFRYIHDSWSTIVPNPLWGIGTSNFQNVQTNFVGPGTSFVARLTANITPTMVNEFVASYTADHIFLTALNNPPLPSGFAMGSIFPNGFGGKLPAIQLNGNTAYGSSLGQDTGYFPWNNANPVYTYRDNLTKTVGTHTLIMGVYFAAAQKNEENTANVQGLLTFDTSGTLSTGNSFADLLRGNIFQYQQWNLEAKYYNRYKIVEPYFQDDWRATKRLTLNLGLRLSLFGTYRERYRHAFNLEPTAFNKGASPTIDVDGSQTTFAGSFVPGSGNPFNGIIQCGGTGGTFPVPGFPNASVGGASNPGCMRGHLFNPAPRIGFAFDPKGDGKMAIRGGYGIFFEHTNGNEANTESLEGSAPFALNASQFEISGYPNIGGGGGAIPFFPLGVTSIPNKAIWPYVQQWHFDVQRELPTHIVLTTSYVGSKGTHLTLERNTNQIFPVNPAANPYAPGEVITAADCAPEIASSFPVASTTSAGVPITGQAATNLFVACGGNPQPLRSNFLGYGNVTRLEDTANSTYNALQVSARRTIGDLQLSLAYTYSHSIDDSSDRFDNTFVNSYDIRTNRGPSNFDQRHNFALSYIYALPFFKGSGFKHSVLGGWQISGITVAQTGQPFSVTNGTTYKDNAGVGNGSLVQGNSRPDRVTGVSTSPTSAEKAADAAAGIFGPLLFSPAAFTVPTGLTFGDVGRNTLYLPGRLNFDFGLSKRFVFTERTGLDFKWETFNVFNHTQFGTCAQGGGCSSPVSASLGSSDFGHLTSAHDPRRMQFGLRLYF
jgi:hypothetical protein